MSSPMGLKRVFAFGFGAGCGIVLSACLLWWGISAYAKHQRGIWKTNSITGTFSEFGIATVNDKPGMLVITYALENHTDQDYKVERNGFHIFSVNPKGELVSTGWDEIMDSVFVPAKAKVQLNIFSHYSYGDALDRLFASIKPVKYGELVKEHRPDLNGFVLFDDGHRYRINLPKGW